MNVYSAEICIARATDVIFVESHKAIPIKCFVSHRPPSREDGSVDRAKKKKKKNEHMPVKAELLSTKAWLRGPFVRNQKV